MTDAARIADVRALVLRSSDETFQWKLSWPPRRMQHVLFRILAEDGTSGDCISYTLPSDAARAAMPQLRAALIGRDPHDIEAISYALTDRLRRPTVPASMADICLWDLVGKLHDVPIYKLLGAARDRIRAYASTFMYSTPEDYVEACRGFLSEGFTAIKLHPYGVASSDIELCRHVRRELGDDVELMIDPVCDYSRTEALRVGRVLEELGFTVFESAIADTDIIGLRELRAKLDIPIHAGEHVFSGLLGYPPFVTEGASDAIRVFGDFIGGISVMRKCAALAEAFGLVYDPHSYGTTTVQAAHLHTMLAVHHCDLMEVPVPQGTLDIGMKDVIRVGDDGYVQAPSKPGLGYELDEDAIADLVVDEL